tara:strand:- start:1 stop:324 length:324 start_codon:yes stop_codon:yes gene_type:complete
VEKVDMFGNYIEEGLDDCRYIIDGWEYTAIIYEVNEDHLVVKPISRTNRKGEVEHNTETKFKKLSLPATSFAEIKLALWMDGRGCDNSAIGCSGCYEPYTFLYEGAA